MKKLITNSKLRWLTSLLLMTIIPLGSFILSSASARTKRVSSAKGQPAIAAVARTPIYNTGGFTFGSTQHLLPGAPSDTVGFQDVEPEIKVDLFGTIYITAIQGLSGGVDLWKSTDKGASFTFLGQPDGAQCPVPGTCTSDAGLGGGDDSIDVSTGGYLYVSSLWLGSVTMSTSYDGGIGGALPGQKWEVNPAVANVPSDDRQWVAAYGPQTVYMSYRQVLPAGANASNVIFVAKSTDGGKTFPSTVATFPATSLVTVRREGNLVVDPYNGNLYTSFRPQELNGHTRAELWLLKSTDGGATWSMTQIYQGPTGTDIGNVFPVMAVDRGGNVHLAFSQCDFNSGTANSSNCQVLLMSSADQGTTWLEPVRVNNGVATSYAIFPWMVAGSNGVVDITWYGANITDSTQAANWHVYFAQTTNAMAASPVFNQVQAIPQVVHNADICLKGGACGGNRNLAEYYTVTLDPEGNANIAFADDVTANSTGSAQTWFTKQTGGPSAYTPQAAPAPATFATNINVPGSSGRAEPNAWVDSHNCIFGGAIGGPIVMRSQDAGSTLTTKTVAVGTGFHGGDFDIITLPKADGSRPDQIYTADLSQDFINVHIGKSSDGGNTYVSPGMNGIGGEVNVSSDRMWLAGDRGVPTAPDQTVYLMSHEAASEAIRFVALTNDFAWSVDTSGMTSPELVLPPTSSLPNTNPGPVFVTPNHNVFGIFAASTVTTNTAAPPFGKEPNIWDAIGAPPAAQGLAPGPFTNFPIFKGLIDSPAQAPSPAPTIPPSAITYGSHVANIFPSGVADKAGNVYVVWSTNSTRLNTLQGNGQPSTAFDVWFAASHDGGQNFYGPWKVSSGSGTAIFPWIAAGDAGMVDIAFYQSASVAPPLIADPSNPGALTGGPNNMPAGSTWNVMFAQSLNANSREPVFRVSQASDHIIHTGSISNGGTFGSADRSLLDFFEVAIGPDGLANIFNADNGVAGGHINFMRQNSGPLAVTNPSAVTCLPIPVPTKVVSRKVHGGAGIKDITLLPPLTPRAVECRVPGQTGTTGVDYKVVFTFPTNITNCGTAGTAGGSVVSGPAANECTENLTGLTNGQYITVTLNGVTNVAGDNGPVSATMGLLVGDVNANGRVSNSDVSSIQAQVGAPVDNSNFRNDINANGTLSNGDVAATQAQVGAQLPSTP